MRRYWPVWLALALGLWAGHSQARDVYARVQVAEPYLEMHTGPGGGYPVFHVVERGAWVEVVSRKTEWFKVRTEKGKQGWVERPLLELTLVEGGDGARFVASGAQVAADRRFEVALLGGVFDGASLVGINAGWAFTRHINVELARSEVLGDFSSSQVTSVGLVAHSFTDWRIAPYFGIGVGLLHTEPRVTLVQAPTKDAGFASVSAGLRTYLARNFILRMDYTQYVVFEDEYNNEERSEWKAGFAFFF